MKDKEPKISKTPTTDIPNRRLPLVRPAKIGQIFYLTQRSSGEYRVMRKFSLAPPEEPIWLLTPRMSLAVF